MVRLVHLGLRARICLTAKRWLTPALFANRRSQHSPPLPRAGDGSRRGRAPRTERGQACAVGAWIPGRWQARGVAPDLAAASPAVNRVNDPLRATARTGATPGQGGWPSTGTTPARSWRVASPADARARYRVADVRQPATHIIPTRRDLGGWPSTGRRLPRRFRPTTRRSPGATLRPPRDPLPRARGLTLDGAGQPRR